MMIHEMPDVCAVVEVTTEHEGVLDCQVSTEREEPPVTSSTLYPRLQVSPISSCGGRLGDRRLIEDDLKDSNWRCFKRKRSAKLYISSNFYVACLCNIMYGS